MASAKLLTTTTTAALSGGPIAPTTVALTSVTGVAAPTAAGGVQTMLYIDGELMTVQAVSGLFVTVQRGQGGTKVANHANGAAVWLADPSFFAQYAFGGPFPFNGRYRYFTQPIVGSLTTLGTSTSNIAGSIFMADVFVPRVLISTGGAILNGATVGTDAPLVALYDYSGALIAQSLGATTSGASGFQQRAWVNPVVLVPGQYFIAYQTVGTTDNFQTIKTTTYLDILASSQTGTFNTLPNPITVPATFTADKGPIAYIY